ncbi:hypothetical protein [Alienimonas sp. DA493]|uniref:hypothetical protein n=1 Tax=Alienimonas sp. DA493 TaxID=3373605 RepID=UPI003754BCEE
MTDAPTTTGRRTWRLVRTLALPWVVCGGLLWALCSLTPDPKAGWVRGGDPENWGTRGLSARWTTDSLVVGDLHPAAAAVVWNERGLERFLADGGTSGVKHRVAGWPAFKLAVWFDRGADGSFWAAVVGLWWLLPVPLIWSAFNLWRWVRRGSMQ